MHDVNLPQGGMCWSKISSSQVRFVRPKQQNSDLGEADLTSVELFHLRQVWTWPYSIREPHYVPRIITELEFTLLPGKGKSFLFPVSPLIFYWVAPTKQKMPFPGCTWEPVSYVPSRWVFCWFWFILWIEKHYLSKYDISEHSRNMDFSVPQSWEGPSRFSLPRGAVTEADLPPSAVHSPPHHCMGTSVCAAAPGAGSRTRCGENLIFFLISDRKEQSQCLFSKSAVCLCGCIFTTKQRKLYAFFHEFYELYKFFLKHAGSLFIHVIM